MTASTGNFRPNKGGHGILSGLFQEGRSLRAATPRRSPAFAPFHPHREPVDPQHARPADPYKAHFEQLNRKLDRIFEALSADIGWPGGGVPLPEIIRP